MEEARRLSPTARTGDASQPAEVNLTRERFRGAVICYSPSWGLVSAPPLLRDLYITLLGSKRKAQRRSGWETGSL